jgi:predicted DNA-binding ribbon-helix-helix protein
MRRRRKLFSGGRVAARNIYLGPRRTSLRLEAVMWEALADIAEDQDKTVNDVILELSRERPHDLNLSAEIRVLIVEFYRARFKGRPRPLQRANGRALAGRTVKVLLPE